MKWTREDEDGYTLRGKNNEMGFFVKAFITISMTALGGAVLWFFWQIITSIQIIWK